MGHVSGLDRGRGSDRSQTYGLGCKYSPCALHKRGIPATDVLLDLPIPKAFHAWVSADVLIDSPSSFCFATAVLSYGEVWDHAFWHTSPLDRWISCVWVDGEARCNNLDPCEKHY